MWKDLLKVEVLVMMLVLGLERRDLRRMRGMLVRVVLIDVILAICLRQPLAVLLLKPGLLFLLLLPHPCVEEMQQLHG